MTFDRAKILAEGGTYHGADNPLTESAPFTATKIEFAPVLETGAAPATIKEDANLPKRMVIEGVFQRFMPAGADPDKYRNANKRVYMAERLKNVFDPSGSVQKRIAEKAMIGHLEHPQDGTTDLNKGAIRVERVWMENDGTVMGRAIVFNTPEGQRIQEYVTTGTKIGISSRGTGTVDAKGFVCEDFQLETWDMVYNPSTFGAHPGLKTEGTHTTSEPAVHESAAVAANPAGATITAQDMPMTFAAKITAALDEAKALLAVDAKRLSESQRQKLAADILNLRAKIAEEFTGEKRLPEIAEAIAKLDAARHVAETDAVGGFRDAQIPAGPATGVGVPGAVATAVTALPEGDRAKAMADFNAVAEMVAANIGALPVIKSAVESALKPADAAPAAPVQAEAAEVSEEVRDLLAEARDEILSLTEREEAASALVTEMRACIESLKSKLAEADADRDALAGAIADLTATKAPKVAESTEKAPAVAPAAEPAKPQKTLAERLAAKTAAPKVDESALPPKGAVVESQADAAKDSTDLATKLYGDQPAVVPVTESAPKLAASVIKLLAG